MIGKFYGIGVGPGEPGMISVAAWECVKKCDLIFVPKAKNMAFSVARACLPLADIPHHRFREVEFAMDADRDALTVHYDALASSIGDELRAGKDVAYLTLGDALTYSTYIYTLTALSSQIPHLHHRTYPGITSYCALAAATGFALGYGKENVLILPCPDDVGALRSAVENHDVVVLMKIGARLPMVVTLLRDLGIARYCSLGSHVGMADERIYANLETLDPGASAGYLATMLIRRAASLVKSSDTETHPTPVHQASSSTEVG